MSTGLLKYLNPVLQPLYRKYFSRTRSFRYKSIRILVYPEVFYPGYIFSTKILLEYLDNLDLPGKTFLELGAGSGIISLVAASKGAIVTASDINPEAVRNILDNARMNKLILNVRFSDMFNNISETSFNYVVIVPPYYPKDPLSYGEMAWYCGKNYEYFEKLFSQLHCIYNEDCTILMVLSEDCDISAIKVKGAKYGFEFSQVLKKKKLGEWNYIFRCDLSSADV
jgi:release factor glutamine methyltransferase